MIDDSITTSRPVTRDNYKSLEIDFNNKSEEQYICKAFCYKVQEFNEYIESYFPEELKTANWAFESNIAHRAKLDGHKEKKPWTHEEESLLQEMFLQNIPFKEICGAIPDRSSSSIQKKLTYLRKKHS